MDQPVIIISAMSSDMVIGIEDGMPWNVPEEYQQYLNFIKDQTVIMGRKSFEIFGPDLTSKYNIIISGKMPQGAGFQVCGNLNEAIAKARKFGKKIFVAGGASVYNQALPLANEMYLSIIKGSYRGTAFFPQFNAAEWDLFEQGNHFDYKFYKYKRVNADK